MKDKHHMISLMWNLAMDTNEIICRTETDSLTLKNLWLSKRTGWGKDGLGVWDWHMHTEIYGMISQCGPAV